MAVLRWMEKQNARLLWLGMGTVETRSSREYLVRLLQASSSIPHDDDNTGLELGPKATLARSLAKKAFTCVLPVSCPQEQPHFGEIGGYTPTLGEATLGEDLGSLG